MPRRLLLTIATVVLAAALGGAGCADDVSPAVSIGDRSVSHDDFLVELEAWSSSPSLVQALQIPFLPGNDDTGYSTDFADIVLSNRVAFELHNEEFEARRLELTDDDLSTAREAVPPGALDEMGEEYADLLVADIARQFKVQEALGEGYAEWAQGAFTRSDIDVSPRYGRWDATTGTVVAPDGPQAPARDTSQL